MRQPLGCKILLVLITLALVMAGCSRMNLAYRNLHLLIPWSLDDYLDMTRDQRQRLDAQLREHLSWHCRTQLPVYLSAIDRLRRQAAEGQVSESALRAHYQQARQAINAIAVEITPTTIRLLKDLDEEQVRELGEAFQDDRREHEQKYLEPALAQQVRERAERVRERVEDWLGSTNSAQRQRIHEWAQGLGAQNRIWLANRGRLQQTLMDSVARRHEAGFEQRITELLQNPEAFWTADYQAAFPRLEQVTIDLAKDLFALSDSEQRRHFQKQLDDLHKDLRSLECLP